MIPEIAITCRGERKFINAVTVEQYKKYVNLMQINVSDKRTDAMFFDEKILQGMFGNQMSLDEFGEMDVIEFLSAAKGIHFIMQDIISQKFLNLVELEPVEREESAFDEYDLENGYEEEQKEENAWKICGEIIDRVVKIAIRLLKNSYADCMKADAMELLNYLKFELDSLNENQM